MARSIIALLIAIAVCFGAAAIGRAITTPAIPGWYAALSKPAWTPPNAAFGLVWSVLYLMMAVAAWLVWRRAAAIPVALPMTLFGFQLAANVAWVWLFFGLHMLGVALLEIAILWCLIAATTYAFWRVRPLAGALLLPYLAWVTFASALNAAIWRMNA